VFSAYDPDALRLVNASQVGALAASTLVAEVQEGAGGLEQVVKTVHNAYTPPTQPCGDWGNFM
jgi:hypothetical protein